jgi:hypothetical protein
VRRRQRPAPPPEELTTSEMAALYRASVPPGWRLDGPEFDGAQHRVEQLLAARWRRRSSARPASAASRTRGSGA